MKTYTETELKAILAKHAKWLINEGGERADLRNPPKDADLSDADLRNANLFGANLTGANLSEADLTNTKMDTFQIVPEEGSFIAFKKLRDGVIAKLLVPENAKRVNGTTRKCRVSHAVVLELSNNVRVGYSSHGNNFTYVLGETVYPDSFNNDIREICTNGIHCFITKKEAEEYF